MKRIILLLSVCAVALTALSSCKKSLTEQLPGTYHFKMSGNFDCRYGTNKDSVIVLKDTATFVTNALTGTMRIVTKDDSTYFVNMSIQLGGELMSFTASLQNDSIILDKHSVTINVSPEGGTLNDSLSTYIQGTAISAPVPVVMWGIGKLYSDTIMLSMMVEGQFKYFNGDNELLCEIIPQTSDIVCEAYKR